MHGDNGTFFISGLEVYFISILDVWNEKIDWICVVVVDRDCVASAIPLS